MSGERERERWGGEERTIGRDREGETEREGEREGRGREGGGEKEREREREREHFLFPNRRACLQKQKQKTLEHPFASLVRAQVFLSFKYICAQQNQYKCRNSHTPLNEDQPGL